jgi:hypothetical protein
VCATKRRQERVEIGWMGTSEPRPPQKKERKKKDCCHPYQSSWSAQFVRCFLPFMLKQKENHNAWTWARTHTQHRYTHTGTRRSPSIDMSRDNDNQARIRLTAGGTSDHRGPSLYSVANVLMRRHTHTYGKWEQTYIARILADGRANGPLDAAHTNRHLQKDRFHARIWHA